MIWVFFIIKEDLPGDLGDLRAALVCVSDPYISSFHPRVYAAKYKHEAPQSVELSSYQPRHSVYMLFASPTVLGSPNVTLSMPGIYPTWVHDKTGI